MTWYDIIASWPTSLFINIKLCGTSSGVRELLNIISDDWMRSLIVLDRDDNI